jgi:CheY-like chemotaxis protein/HPt (histidine-containing phosphotransfer) domain-containing protein
VNLTNSNRWSLVNAFMEDLRSRLGELERAVPRLADTDEFVRAEAARAVDDAAHSVRGASMTVGMLQIAALAAIVKQEIARALCGEPGADRAASDSAASLLEPLRALARSRLGVRDAQAAGCERIPKGLVLHIEDNLSNLKLVEHVFDERPELTLVEARTGTTGLVLAEDLDPDLVLLDLRLPDISGQEVLRRIRGDHTAHRPRVIVISAEARPVETDRILAAGAHGYLVKPIDADTLLEVVDDSIVKAKA